MADDIRELNALVADYGREFQSPDPRRGPSLGSSRLYADYQPATSSEQAEMVLSMLPGIGEGLDAAYISQGIEEEDLGKAATGLGGLLLPFVGAGTIKQVAKRLGGAARSEKPVIDKFTTNRGSTYELFDDATTQRNRSGVGHKDTSTGLQPVSNKTVFVDKEGLVDVGGIFQNPDIATRLNPVFDDKGNITSMAVDLTEDFGPRRAGERIAEVPVTTQPAVGKYPVEIMSPESPRGSSGRGVHFGSEIIDVQSKTPAEGLSELFYRGSSNLDELAGKYSLPKEGVLGGGGVYVTPDPDYASNYAVQTALGEPKTGGFVAPLNVKFDNPLIIDIKTAQEKVAPELKVLKALGLSDDKAADMLESAYEKTGGLTNQISSRAKKQGFDGIVLRNEDGTIQEAVSYNTQNIRSAFEEVIKNSDKDLKKYRSGGSIERNPYKHEPKAI